MSTSADRRVVWIDTETTSLHGEDPRTLLLEVGLVVTDLELEEVARENLVIAWSSQELEEALWDPVARTMHESGLLEECRGPLAVPLPQAEARLLHFLACHKVIDPWSLPEAPGNGATSDAAPLWGGCSPWLDRTILRRCMLRLYEKLHYRTIDATTLKLALELWGGEVTHRANKPHRALKDAVSAVKLADRARRWLKKIRKEWSLEELLTPSTA